MNNILHYIPAFDVGGIETLLINWSNSLISEEINLYLLVYETARNNERLYEFEKLGGKIFYIPPFTLKTYKDNEKKIKGIINLYGIDTIHCHSLATSNFLLRIAKKNKVKHRIFHAHTNRIEGTKLKKIIKKYLIKNSISNANKLLACSDEAGIKIFRKNSYEVILNGIDSEKFKFNSNDRRNLREKYNVKDNEFLLGYVARITESKNHIFLINLMDKLINFHNKKNLKLILVGDGPLRKALEEKISIRKLEKNVIFAGNVSDTGPYYSAMDVFLFPSSYEGFGMVALEAQLSGLPVLKANNLPVEVDLFESLIYHLDIEEPNDKWIDLIIKLCEDNESLDISVERSIYSLEFEDSIYNSKNSVIKLKEIYLS